MGKRARMGAGIVMATLAIATAASGTGFDRQFLDYHDDLGYLPESPSVTGGAVSIFGNPAAAATAGHVESAFWWNDRALGEGGLGNWGFAIGRRLGIGFQRQRVPTGPRTYTVYDYQIGLSTGDRERHYGIAWRWSTGDGGRLGRKNAIVLGGIFRPGRRVSYGLSSFLSTESSDRAAIFDIGVRPFVHPLLTFFADYSLRPHDGIGDGRWGGGVRVRPTTGIDVGVKFREAEGDEDFRFTLNLGITLDRQSAHILPTYDDDGDLGATSYLLRFNPPQRGIGVGSALRRELGPRRYVPVNLENRVLTYQRAQWLDRSRVAWIDLIDRLNAIRDEPSAVGVALNLSGFRTSAALAWELRGKLEELRRAGKEVIVHADRLGFVGYYLASVADHLTLDPEGYVSLPGVATHRTYLSAALQKLGVGFEELRFFSYKSALESYSRDSMSEADREQLGRMVDVIYEEVRDRVADSRGIAARDFDDAVDREVILTAEVAREHALIDAVSRWADLGDWLREERQGARLVALPDDPDRAVFPDERWGRPPEVNIVYAVGVCAMDEGVKGRATSRRLRQLAEDDDVAAVVVRVDSPGGDPLPSDLIADGIVRIRDEGKPVVVSQGSVAASGGYWISMDADRILTTPFTVTGSIGVIGGWFWDDGLGEKTGFTADGVQRGAHADLFTGIRYPYIGLSVPERGLSSWERSKVEERFRSLYDRFVERVSAGRGLDDARTRTLGEGRVWMGGDAVERGLCDAQGSLEDAIASARELAGIDPDEEVIVEEFPPRRLVAWPDWLKRSPIIGSVVSALVPRTGMVLEDPQPGSIGSTTDPAGRDYEDAFVRLLAAAPGQPQLLTPVEMLPEAWRDAE